MVHRYLILDGWLLASWFGRIREDTRASLTLTRRARDAALLERDKPVAGKDESK